MAWRIPTRGVELANTTVGGISQVRVGNEAGYSILLSDPDNTAASTTFSTTGWFTASSGTTLSVDQRTLYIPNQAASDRLEQSPPSQQRRVLSALIAPVIRQ